MGNGEQEVDCAWADPAPLPVTVYKVGGSLFDWSELFARLKAFLATEQTSPLIVSGGGNVADVIRNWDRVHGLGEARAHHLAIASLSVGSEFLADGLGARLVTDRQSAAAAWSAGNVAVLDARVFMAAESARGVLPLPASWNVTSDSIAAWIATAWPARLVLLKSTSLDEARTPFVDSYFETASDSLCDLEWVNLRSGERGRFAGRSEAMQHERVEVNDVV